MTAALWTTGELVHASGGEVSLPFHADGISIDTRTLAPGDLFVALLGEGRDGHEFLADAFAKGAAGAMVHNDVPANGPLLRVDDTLAGLARLGLLPVRASAKRVGVSSRLPAASVRPRPRKCCVSRCRLSPRPTHPRRPITTIGACR